jgi:hypothetical protein
MHGCAHACVYGCSHACVYARMCMHMHVCVYMHVCMFMNMHVCVCMYTYVFARGVSCLSFVHRNMATSLPPPLSSLTHMHTHRYTNHNHTRVFACTAFKLVFNDFLSWCLALQASRTRADTHTYAVFRTFVSLYTAFCFAIQSHVTPPTPFISSASTKECRHVWYISMAHVDYLHVCCTRMRP